MYGKQGYGMLGHSPMYSTDQHMVTQAWKC